MNAEPTPVTRETPLTEVEQLRQQNALLLRRLMVVSRERDALRRQLEHVPESTQEVLR